MYSSWLVLFLCLVFEASVVFSEVVTTETGKVEGFVKPSSLYGKFVEEFMSIPYAEAPVGKLRFQKPVPRKPSNETINKSNMSISCWQLRYDVNSIMTEDCLVLNIWRPYPKKTNLTVMVWIHGGYFRSGKGNDYSGNNFVAVGDVILVTINYRLSFLGFLSSGDQRIKGNFGLFDQRLALKWVKENIATFGGNPDSITIFGESAGGASVSAHTLSKHSWPYFNRAILQSGGMNMPWAMGSRTMIDHSLNYLLNEINCTNDKELMQCLQNNMTEKDLEKLYHTNSTVNDNVLLLPVVDGDFITQDPKMLLKNGEIKNSDVLLGVTKDERFLMYGHLLLESHDVSFYVRMFETVLKSHLKNSSEEVYNKVRQLYQSTANFKSSVEAIKPLIDIQSDLDYVCPARSEANTRATVKLPSTSIYFYRYSYATPVILPVPIYPNGTKGFVAHALDIWSVFGASLNRTDFPFEDRVLSMRMILYWTNFAKNGNPNIRTTKLPIVLKNVDNLPQWPKFTNLSREYLDMESSSRMLAKQRMRKKYCEFLSDPQKFTMSSTVLPETTMKIKPTGSAVQHSVGMTAFIAVFLNILKLL